jgi:hypothetical protein
MKTIRSNNMNKITKAFSRNFHTSKKWPEHNNLLIGKGIGIPLTKNRYDTFTKNYNKNLLYNLFVKSIDKKDLTTSGTISNPNGIIVWDPSVSHNIQCDGVMVFAEDVMIEPSTYSMGNEFWLDPNHHHNKNNYYQEKRRILFKFLDHIKIDPNDPVEKHLFILRKPNGNGRTNEPLNTLFFFEDELLRSKSIKDIIKSYIVGFGQHCTTHNN